MRQDYTSYFDNSNYDPHRAATNTSQAKTSIRDNEKKDQNSDTSGWNKPEWNHLAMGLQHHDASYDMFMQQQIANVAANANKYWP